jgi:hypothetical protein
MTRLQRQGTDQPRGSTKLDKAAGVVKLVYTQVLGTCAERREGSSPFSRTLFSPGKPVFPGLFAAL